VVIPAYNAEATIGATLRSVQAQTLADIEIVVVDDGSKDRTLEEVAKIGDSRVKVCGDGAHRGTLAARDLGLKESSSEFISFLDADDVWTHDKLELQVAALTREPAAEVAYSWTVFVDEGGGYLFAKEPARFEGGVYADLATGNFLASASNALARTDCLSHVGGFDEAFGPAADWEYWLRVAAGSDFAVVPRYQILYRFRRGSLSTNTESMEAGLRAVHRSVFARGGPELSRRSAEARSNIAQYLSFLHLMRTTSPQSWQRASRLLRESVTTNPRAFLSRKVQFLLWILLVTFPLPRRAVPTVARKLLTLYGRLMRPARVSSFGESQARGRRLGSGPPAHDDATAEQIRELVTKGAMGAAAIFTVEDVQTSYES
jgi:glycosyltransferase involved in cell wall biosynthesis